MTRTPPRLFFVAFALFAGSVAFSLAGMLALQLAPAIAGRVGAILGLLMTVPTWIYSVTLPLAVFLAFHRIVGARRGLAFAAWGILIGASAELIGTTTGFPFGPYSYSDFLGPKILGHVPYAIPASWYAAALLSFSLASATGVTRARRVLLAAAFMVLWDVALDPAMSAGFPIWLWHVEGFFYGMPLVNWFGWFVTALVIMLGFEVIQRREALAGGVWPAVIWSVNGVFAIGICVKAGLWLAVLIGAVAIALPPLLAMRRRPFLARVHPAIGETMQVAG